MDQAVPLFGVIGEEGVVCLHPLLKIRVASDNVLCLSLTGICLWPPLADAICRGSWKVASVLPCGQRIPRSITLVLDSPLRNVFRKWLKSPTVLPMSQAPPRPKTRLPFHSAPGRLGTHCQTLLLHYGFVALRACGLERRIGSRAQVIALSTKHVLLVFLTGSQWCLERGCLTLAWKCEFKLAFQKF